MSGRPPRGWEPSAAPTVGLIRYFVDHPTAANLVLLTMIAAGIGGLFNLRSQHLPDIVIERVHVAVPWEGAGPEDVDRGVVDALEPHLIVIDGVESVRSVSRDGIGEVTLEFAPGADMGVAFDEVGGAVEQITTLPEDADAPQISLGRFEDRVTVVVISGPLTPAQLDLHAQELRGRLFRDGVTRVRIEGVNAPRIRVEVSEAALQQHGLTLSGVAERVAAEAAPRPAGALEGGAGRVRAGEARTSAAALGEVAVKTLTDGSRLLLRDVAEIRELGSDYGLAYFNRGEAAVQLRVARGEGGDSIAIQRQVEQIVAAFRADLPDGVVVELTQTQSQAIVDRLAVLYANGLTGLAIVLLTLFLFLSARTAFWVSAGIPAALLAAIALMWATGLTVNMISLFAMIICLGIVVDDAIVVGEHADHLARRGMAPADAAATAAQRMALPVFCASVTTIIAFLVMGLIGGKFGGLILDIPWTVGMVVAASLIECFFVLPAHMRGALAAEAAMRARALGGAGRRVAWFDWPSHLVNQGFMFTRERGLRPIMRFLVRWRYHALAGAVALLAVTLSLRFDGSVPWRFWSGPERGVVDANVLMTAGAARADTFEMLERLRLALEETDRAFAERYGRGPVENAVAKLGALSGAGIAGAEIRDADLLGSISVELIDPDYRPYSQDVFMRAWRERAAEHPLLETLSIRGEETGPLSRALRIEITGDAATEPAALKAAAEALAAELDGAPGVRSFEDSMPYDAPELALTLTPKGEALGFTTESLGAELRARLAGLAAARFPREGREAEIEVALPEASLDASFLYRTRVPVPGRRDVTVALTDVVEISRRPSFGAVRRLDGRRVALVTVDVTDAPRELAALRARLRDVVFPAIEGRFGVLISEGGLAREERNFLRDAALALTAGLIGVYLTLAWVFASWARPMAVMAAIPFGLVGAIWGHYAHGLPLSVFSLVGLIGMAGIIVNDSIVLVSAIDARARRQAMAEAVVDGVCDRFRAVLLTTLTTVGGLAPLLFEGSRQALFLKPTVVTLAWGLGFGLVVVLVITPALVMLQHDVGRRLTSLRRLASHLRRRRPALGARRADGAAG